jgi:hypothetical protein
VQQLLQYIVRYASDFSSRVAGADASEIAELERMAGRPLPPAYRDFLATLGRDDGGLRLGVEASSRIDRVLAHYREHVLTGQESVPKDGLVIAVGGVVIEEVCLVGLSGQTPAVAFASGDRIVGPYADSLEQLLFRLAFTKYRLAAFPVSGRYTGAEAARRLAEAEKKAVGLGFERQWFSDSLAFCGESPRGLAIALSEYQGLGLAVRVAGRDRAEVEEIGDDFARSFGLRFEG